MAFLAAMRLDFRDDGVSWREFLEPGRRVPRPAPWKIWLSSVKLLVSDGGAATLEVALFPKPNC